MKFTFDETGKRGWIDMDGPLTIRNIAEAKELLMSALRQVDVLEFQGGDSLSEADLSALQLGCSLKRTALKLNKTVLFPKTPPPAVSRVAEEAGGCLHSGCQLYGDRCFFLKRGLD